MRALAFAFALLASGCGFFHHGPGGGDDPGSGVEGAWALRSAELGDSLYVPADGEANELRLRSGRADVASCNGCSGRYRRDGQALVFAEMVCTEMACPGRIDLGPELGAGPLRYRLGDGALVLRRGADGAVFTFGRRE